MNRRITVAALLAFVACRDITLPGPAPAPKPGSISGRVVAAEPGRPVNKPVAGAQIEVLGSGLVTFSDQMGYFRLEGISSEASQVLFRSDRDSDGRPDLQKLLALQALKAGLGKDVVLGDVLLSENAVLKGQVLREDVPSSGGHGGTLVFVPVGPYQTTTADDGSFALNELPEGTLSVAFFRAGYVPDGFSNVTLSGGQQLVTRTVRLKLESTIPPPANVSGRVRLIDGSLADGAQVRLDGTGPMRQANTGADGTYRFDNVETGIYSLTASRAGSADARLLNILLSGGDTALPDIVLGAGQMGGTGGGGGSTGTGGGGFSGTGGFGSTGGGGGSPGTGGGTATGGGSGGGGPGTGGGGGSAGTGGGLSGAGGGMVTIPPVPTNLAVASSDSALTVTWNPSMGATDYTLYWSLQPNVNKTNGTALAHVTSPFVHEGLLNGTSYYYVVAASSSAGESAASMMASGTPGSLANQPLSVVVTRPDANQRGVFANSTVVARLNKSLSAATVNATTVTLRAGPTVVPASVTVSGNTVTLTPTAALNPETMYTATLSTGVQDTGGNPLPAAYIWSFTTTSPPPSNLREVLGNASVTMAWNLVPGATGYVLQRSTTPGGPVSRSMPTPGTTFTDDTTTTGTQFYYRVVARTPFGLTAPSNEVDVITSNSPPAAPTTLEVHAGRSTALVRWSPVTAADTYVLYRASSSAGAFTPVANGLATTAYLDTGLTPGTAAYYRVQSVTSTGSFGRYSDEVSAVLLPNLPSAPAGLTATVGTGWLQLSWTAVPSAQAYVVYQIADDAGPVRPLAYVTSGTQYAADGLVNGTTYRHFVGAVVNDAVGDLAEVAAIPLATGVPQGVNLESAIAESASIALAWSGSTGQNGYNVYRSTAAGGPYTNVGTPLGVSFIDTMVTPGTRYFYTVKPKLTSGLEGAVSNELSAVPLAAGTPAVPTGFTAEASNGAVQFSWAPAANADGYEIYVSNTPGGPYTTYVAGTTDTFATRVSGNRTNATIGYFALRAVNGNSTRSAFTAEVAATPTSMGLTTPTPSVRGGNAALTVYWAPVSGATTYRVFRRTPMTDWQELGTARPEVSLTDTTVVNGTPYRYAVQAMNPTGPRVSVWGQTNLFVAPSAKLPPRPQGFTVVPIDDGFMVRWRPFAGASDYAVNGGYVAGSSALSGAPISCYVSDAFETRCRLSADDGTPYFVSMVASTTDGSSANTDEVMVLTNPTGPATPAVVLNTGNARVNVAAPPVAGATQYRIYRRTFERDWELVTTKPTAYLAEPAVNGTDYRYAIEAVTASSAVSAWGITAFASPSDEDPVAVTGTVVTGGQDVFAVSWNPIDGVEGYSVYQSDAPDVPLVLASANTNSPYETRVNGSRPNGMPATLSVAAYTHGGRYGTFLEVVTATVNPQSPATPAVGSLSGNEAIQLTWGPVATATSYRISRRPLDGELQPLVTVTSPRYTDYSVQNGEQFAYAVQAVNANGTSGYSQTGLLLVDGTATRAPANVVVTPGDGALQVEWDPVAGSVSYSVFASATQGGPYSFVGSSSGGFDSRLTLVSLTNGATRWVGVTATIASNSSVMSVPTSGTPLATLPGRASVSAAAQATPGTVRLTWSAVSDATNYRVYRRTATGPISFVGMVTASPFNDSGLASGTAYRYYVETENAAGKGVWSSVANVTPN